MLSVPPLLVFTETGEQYKPSNSFDFFFFFRLSPDGLGKKLVYNPFSSRIKTEIHKEKNLQSSHQNSAVFAGVGAAASAPCWRPIMRHKRLFCCRSLFIRFSRTSAAGFQRRSCPWAPVSTPGTPKGRHQARRSYPRDRTPVRNEAILQPDSWLTKVLFLINRRFFRPVRRESWLEPISFCRRRRETPYNIPDGRGRSWCMRHRPSVTPKPPSFVKGCRSLRP